MDKKDIHAQDRVSDSAADTQNQDAAAVIIPVDDVDKVKNFLEKENVEARYSILGKGNEEGMLMVASAHQQTVSYSGPIPPAPVMDHYESICPGAADRIISMAEKEQERRFDYERQELELVHELKTQALKLKEKELEATAGAEEKLTNDESQIRSRGQILGFLLISIAMLLAAFFFYKGHDIAGGVFLGATLLGVVSKFIPSFK